METRPPPAAHHIMAPPSPPPPSPPSPTRSLLLVPARRTSLRISPTPPAALPKELIEEILLRLPPGEPESLFRAALVCKPWCRLISGPRFRRRFRDLHRTPPMLGFLNRNGFVPTNAFSRPRAGRLAMRVLDARHGRVLAQRHEGTGCSWGSPLMVWDPITDEQRVLPRSPWSISSTAAVLCAGAGVCDHLDCHRGPFLVVNALKEKSRVFLWTYSSNDDAWSEPVSIQHLDNFGDLKQRTVLVGNAIYFEFESTNIALKFSLESYEISLIQLPDKWNYWRRHVLTTTEEGLLGLVIIFDSKLTMWLRNGPPEIDAGWTMIRVIDLKMVLPFDGVFTSPFVVGFADGPAILFMFMKSDLYAIDLKTHKVEFYQGKGNICIVPYMSFYTPELQVACIGDEPSAGGSNA